MLLIYYKAYNKRRVVISSKPFDEDLSKNTELFYINNNSIIKKSIKRLIELNKSEGYEMLVQFLNKFYIENSKYNYTLQKNLEFFIELFKINELNIIKK